MVIYRQRKPVEKGLTSVRTRINILMQIHSANQGVKSMLTRRILPGILLILLGTLTVLSGCAVIIGSGELETREYEYTEFTRIEIGYAFEAEISQDNSFTVKITLDDNIFEYLDISQSGETLIITMKPGNVFTNVTQRAVITLPDLERLELSGASQADVSGFSSSHDLDFTVSGASKINISDITSADVTMEISGASRADGKLTMTNGDFDISGASSISLEGSAQDIIVDASGASRVNLDDFEVVNIRIDLSGASSGTINASGLLSCDLSGASHLYYIGNPILDDINTSGASSISQK